MGRQSTLGRAASGNGAENPVLAEVIRSGRTESIHRGAVIALGPDGAVLDTGQGRVRAGAVERAVVQPAIRTAHSRAAAANEGSSLRKRTEEKQPGIRNRETQKPCRPG